MDLCKYLNLYSAWLLTLPLFCLIQQKTATASAGAPEPPASDDVPRSPLTGRPLSPQAQRMR